MTRYGGTATEIKQVLSIDLESKAIVFLFSWWGEGVSNNNLWFDFHFFFFFPLSVFLYKLAKRELGFKKCL